MTDQNQMELGFDGSCVLRPALHRPQRGLSRAKWWFERMRQVVDRALDWQAGPPCPPKQIWFADKAP